MGGVSKTFAMAVTALSTAVILVILFAWVGPGIEGVTRPASASVLFDEQQVQQIYDRVSPAVVEIVIENELEESFTPTGFGSGFVIDQDGHIATNNHVVEGNNRVRVKFLDGRYAEATVLGRNPANDIALIKVDPAAVSAIEPVVLGDSSLVKPGQLAIAIGSPFQLEGTVTAGIISGVNRALPSQLGRSISGVIQTDALIAPGNSGGPLLNSSGQVVGINTAIEIPISIIQERSAGFAVPINSLTQHLPDLKESVIVRPPWLGVSVTDVEPVLAEMLGLSVEQGVYITGVADDSPALEAGLVPSKVEIVPGEDISPEDSLGDVIIAVDGTPVNNVTAMIAELNRHQPGDSVTLAVVREGENLDVTVILDSWPDRQRSGIERRFFHRELPDGSIHPEFPREFRIPRFHHDFEIPGFTLPDLTPAIP